MSLIKVDIPIVPLDVPDSVRIMSDIFNPSCSGTFRVWWSKWMW